MRNKRKQILSCNILNNRSYLCYMLEAKKQYQLSNTYHFIS